MNSGLPCYIGEIVTAVPEYWLGMEDGTQLLAQTCTDPRRARLLQRVTKLTGIRRRYLAALEHQPEGQEDRWLYRRLEVQPNGPGMEDRTTAFHVSADRLVQRLLAQVPAEQLARTDNLVTVSCTHASAPGLEAPVFAHTSVPPTVSRWNLGFMGCSASLAGIRLVHQIAGRDSRDSLDYRDSLTMGRRSLVLACELSSLHFQYTDQLDQMTANVLFADGAAAMILSPEPSPVRVLACRCASLPQYASQMVWLAADHGLKLRLSQDLPDTLAAHLPDVVAWFLDQCNTSRTDVDHWLVHPGGPQILDAVQNSLSLPDDALDVSRGILRDYGNMSSPTIFFIMKAFAATHPRGRAVAMAFGPGLTIELVLLEFAGH